MIHVQNLCFSYSPGEKPIFTKFNLEIELFSWVVVTGPDGSGKSTLGKLIKGLLEPGSGYVDVQGYPSTDVGYLGGDPCDSLIGVSVEEEVVFGLENLCLPASEIDMRLARSLEQTGLTGMERRLTHTLSGGEQQRLALAAVLAMGTRILVIDEALNMLDKRARKSARSLLATLRRDTGLTVIELSNDLETAFWADRIIFLQQGRILVDGAPGWFLSQDTGSRWAAMGGGLGALRGALIERNILADAALGGADLVSLLTKKVKRDDAQGYKVLEN